MGDNSEWARRNRILRPTRWSSSRPAMLARRRGDGSATRRAELMHWGVGWALELYDDRGTMVWMALVTGRTVQHVDRLARDWIGHGVAPTRGGKRGVRDPRRPARIVRGVFRETTAAKASRDRFGRRAWIADGGADLARFDRAEVRARKVVQHG